MTMRSRIAPLAALAAVLLAACTERPSPQDYLAVVPQVVTLMAEDARQNALGRPPAGPLWVDARGFAALSERVTGEPITEQQVVAALGRGTRRAEPRQVLLAATDEDVLGGTWVREYGLYVSPNVARGAGDEITVFVGNYVTDRRALPTTICDRVWELTFRREAPGRWAPAARRLVKGCLEEE